MKNTICEIYLNPNGHCNGVYHSGQKLSGNVVLTFYEKQRIKSMFWSFCILSDYFVSCVNFSIYSLWSLQILWFKFSASANVNGMKRADHIMAKKFISKMKLKSQNLLKVCKILLNESVDILLIFLVLKIQKKMLKWNWRSSIAWPSYFDINRVNLHQNDELEQFGLHQFWLQ